MSNISPFKKRLSTTEDDIYAFIHLLTHSLPPKKSVECYTLCLEYNTNISFCPPGVCSLEECSPQNTHWGVPKENTGAPNYIYFAPPKQQY